eukprot:28604-Eustigmatos_ZCMA.PRE.1
MGQVTVRRWTKTYNDETNDFVYTEHRSLVLKSRDAVGSYLDLMKYVVCYEDLVIFEGDDIPLQQSRGPNEKRFRTDWYATYKNVSHFTHLRFADTTDDDGEELEDQEEIDRRYKRQYDENRERIVTAVWNLIAN